MVATVQEARPTIDRSSPEVPIGIDCGAGLVKVATPHIRLRIPSKFVEVTRLEESLEAPDGGHFYYHSGDAQHLIGKQFLVGSLAYDHSPSTHVKLSDDPKLKAEYALHAVLGAIATMPHQPHWNLYLVLSNHQPDLFRPNLKAIEGKHVVSFGGKENLPTRVNIRVGLVVPEGAGNYVYCAGNKILDSKQHAIAVDLGTSTVIVSAFNPGGKLVFRDVLPTGGCADLMEAIASDPEIVKALGTGRSGNIELIRRGIETKTFCYGNGILVPDFTKIYERHLKTWLAARMRLAKKSLAEFIEHAQPGVVWGGGAELPGGAAMLSSIGWQCVPNAGWINAIGLQKIAQGRLNNG
jgi:Actin like proteins N terminal domain